MTAFLAFAVLIPISMVWVLGIRALYRRSGDVLYPVGGVLLYLWTFFGAWGFIADSLSGFQGYRIGLGYYYYMESMMPFVLDDHYVLGLLAYALFATALLAALWWSRVRAPRPGPIPVRISHPVLMVLGLVCMGFSITTVLPELRAAWRDDVSFDSMIRHHPGRWYALHGILNEAATCCLLFGYAIKLVSTHTRSLFSDDASRWPLIAYPITLLILGLYLSLIGDRHALFSGGILALCYVIGRAGTGAWRTAFLLVAVTVGCLFLGGWVRGFSARERKSVVAQHPEEGPFRVPAIAHVPRHPQGLLARGGNSVLSNEFFAAHFSMYAVLAKDMPIKPFISFKYLAGSVVPSFIRSERPPSSYDHYAAEGHFDTKTGYTIHHATAWYLNFGWVGVALGGLVLGGIWGGLHQLRQRMSGRRADAWAALLPYLFIGFLPMLLRAGPEGYRALVVEGFGVPLVVLGLAALFARAKSRNMKGAAS